MALYDPDEVPTIAATQQPVKKLSKRQHQRNNLKMLADYLWSKPQRYNRLRMYAYFECSSDQEFDINTEEVTNLCGASACALGHGPVAGITLEQRHMNPQVKITSSRPANEWEHDVNWTRYASMEFLSHIRDRDTRRYVEDYIFGGHWIDNTAKGAAQRIYRFLEISKHNAKDIMYRLNTRQLIKDYEKQQPVEA